MTTQEPQTGTRPAGTWGFLTNHAHVLLCIARDPKSVHATSPSKSESRNGPLSASSPSSSLRDT
jgi:hypothetical protein